MISTSTEYKTAVASDTREWALRLKVKAAPHEYNINVNDVKLGTLVYEEAVMTDDFSIGGGIMSELSLTISDEFSNIQLNGADLTAEIGLKVSNSFEYVPLGSFVIDDTKKINGVVSVKAFDNLVKADIPFKNSQYPITLKNIVSAACAQSKIAYSLPGTFYNSNYMIDELKECSCRDVITWAAQIACCWARCDRQGILEFVPLNNAGFVDEADIDGNDTGLVGGGTFDRYNDLSIDGGVFVPSVIDFGTSPSSRSSSSVEDEPVIVTGVVFEADETVFLAGSERYALDISDNALIQRDIPSTVAGLYAKLNGYTYLPFTAEWVGDPAVQAGDLVEHITDGRTFRTVIGKMRYSFRGKSSLSAGGKSATGGQWKTPTQKAQSRIREKLVEKQEQLDLLDKAVATATSVLLAGALGGYAIDGDEVGYPGNHFIADSQNIEQATKVWRWNINGFGYSGTGVNGPYATAITSDGSVVASTVTADAIRTGVLQSLNGKSWIDLDNGAFSLGDGALKWDSVNGFEAVSAKRLTSGEPDKYAKIGAENIGGVLFSGIEFYDNDKSAFKMLGTTGDTIADGIYLYDKNGNRRLMLTESFSTLFLESGGTIGITPHTVKLSRGNYELGIDDGGVYKSYNGVKNYW